MSKLGVDVFFEDDWPEDGEDCPDCDGSGWITADCFEDSCCCADPETEHGVERCDTCNPKRLRSGKDNNNAESKS